MKLRRKKFGNERGQTVLEYLLLLSAAFITTYIVMTGPMGNFTRLMLATIRSSITNVVQNGELTPGQVLAPGQAGHPGDPARAKALHL
ncbi:hypothetical protein K2X33_06350 [bacterium]|nr:hypothetical protein [bacterium]